ncbi:hypothetical protein AB0K60_33290 [Thermopolyspora sp. NPDC052614]|uniref:hypothetical protein n=1 Tax=Thermopolyspora sp. NPDC052614 TaxID=3155682 RepID=UPI00341F22CB
MRERRLIFLGPALLATFAFGVAEAPPASAAPASGSVVTSTNTVVDKLIAPTCKKLKGKRKRRACQDGYNDGFSYAKSTCKRRSVTKPKVSVSAAYDRGYAAGFKAGRKAC